jgi:hypothetical protein
MSRNDMSLVAISRKDLFRGHVFEKRKQVEYWRLKLCYDFVQWQGLVLVVLSLRVLLPKFIIGG